MAHRICFSPSCVKIHSNVLILYAMPVYDFGAIGPFLCVQYDIDYIRMSRKI